MLELSGRPLITTTTMLMTTIRIGRRGSGSSLGNIELNVVLNGSRVGVSLRGVVDGRHIEEGGLLGKRVKQLM